MKVSPSPLTSGGGAAPAKKAQLQRQIQRLEQKKEALLEKLGVASSSSKQPSAPSLDNGKVIMGSGGDQAVISKANPGFTGVVVTGTNGGTAAAGGSAPASTSQKAAIDSIVNPYQPSGEVMAIGADIGSDATQLRRRDAVLDVQMALAKAESSSSDSSGSDGSGAIDERGEILKAIAAIDQQIMRLEQQMQEEEMAEMAGTAMQAAAPEPADAGREGQADAASSPAQSDFSPPSFDKFGHVRGYL